MHEKYIEMYLPYTHGDMYDMDCYALALAPGIGFLRSNGNLISISPLPGCTLCDFLHLRFPIIYGAIKNICIYIHVHIYATSRRGSNFALA